MALDKTTKRTNERMDKKSQSSRQQLEIRGQNNLYVRSSQNGKRKNPHLKIQNNQWPESPNSRLSPDKEHNSKSDRNFLNLQKKSTSSDLQTQPDFVKPTPVPRRQIKAATNRSVAHNELHISSDDIMNRQLSLLNKQRNENPMLKFDFRNLTDQWHSETTQGRIQDKELITQQSGALKNNQARQSNASSVEYPQCLILPSQLGTQNQKQPLLNIKSPNRQAANDQQKAIVTIERASKQNQCILPVFPVANHNVHVPTNVLSNQRNSNWAQSNKQGGV